MFCRAFAIAAVLFTSCYSSGVDLEELDAFNFEEEGDSVSLLQAEVVVQSREKRVKKQPGKKVPSSLPEEGDGSGKPSATCVEAKSGAAPLPSELGRADALPASALLNRGVDAVVDAAEPQSAVWMAAVVIAKLIASLVVLEVVRHAREHFHKGGAAGEEETDAPHEDQWQVLLEAALAGDAVGSKELLGSCHIDMQRVDAWGCSVLHAAAKGGAPAVVDLILAKGGGVHDRDAWDETPLHLAARAGHAEVCDVLLSHGSEANAENAQEWTLLVVAADANQEVACKVLLGHGAGFGGLAVDSLPALLKRLLANSPESEGVDMSADERVSLVDLMCEERSEAAYCRAEDSD